MRWTQSRVTSTELRFPSRSCGVGASGARKKPFRDDIGLPGTGKSADIAYMRQQEMYNGTVLLLKSDRLPGPNWSAHARSLGIAAPIIESLLSEISATGSSVLYIDGIDRIASVSAASSSIS